MRRISFDDLAGQDLVIDTTYSGGAEGNVRDDPLARLLPVGNQGGFRYKGPAPRPRLVVMYTTGDEMEWPDDLDIATGTFTYYGDNRRPGNQLHQTQRQGNAILRDLFASFRQDRETRAELPVLLIFQRGPLGRDVIFRGLAVPGSPRLHSDEELVAIWRADSGERFQNYRAKFTVLDADTVSRAWIDDVLAGTPGTPSAPAAWTAWVEALKYFPLEAAPSREVRTKDQQLPKDAAGWTLLHHLYSTYQAVPTNFEATAVRLVGLSVPLAIEMDVTRPSLDGGRDALGFMSLGPTNDSVRITTALEAKCYNPGTTSVGVKETSRLISRLRHRDVGFMVTTSFIAAQAYEELRADRHPVVVMSGGDIVETLRLKGIARPDALDRWLAT